MFARRVGLSAAASLVVVALAASIALAGASTAGAAVRRIDLHPGPKTGQVGLYEISQSPVVTPGQNFLFTFEVHSSTAAAVHLDLEVTIFDHLITRSAFSQTLSGGSPGDQLNRLAPISLATVPSNHGRMTVSVPITDTASSASALDLGCQPGSCAGVYPIEFALQRTNGESVSRLITFLTYNETVAAEPLRVAAVLPIDLPIARGQLLGRPTRARTEDLDSTARALAANPLAPATVDVVPATLESLALSPSVRSHDVIDELAATSSTNADEFVAPTYIPLDPGTLVGAGLRTELNTQVARGDQILDADRIAVSKGPWLITAGVSDRLAEGLAAAGQPDQVVIPDTDLSTYPLGLRLSQPFTMANGRTGMLNAAASDSVTRSLMASAASDPELAANQILAYLSLYYFEQPGAGDPERGVVVAPPANWVAPSEFAATLLSGLNHNPDLKAITLSQYFATIAVGANGADSVRRADNNQAVESISTRQAGEILSDRAALGALATALPSTSVIPRTLGDGLLATEASVFNARQRSAALARFHNVFDSQLGVVRLVTNRTITLTSRTGRIPITVTSSVPYPIAVWMDITSDKLQFPHGSNRLVEIDRSTNAFYFNVVARTTGDLPVEVTLRTPDMGLVVTRGRLTVRSTAVSLAGVVLTLGALAVLLIWWIRTWRTSRRKARHAPEALR